MTLWDREKLRDIKLNESYKTNPMGHSNTVMIQRKSELSDPALPRSKTEKQRKYEGLIRSASESTDANLTTPTFMFYFRQKKIRVNLFVMSIAWITTIFNFFMMQLLPDTFNQV